MGTSVDRASASTEFWKRGEPWNIPGVIVDGMDIVNVREAAEKAVAHIRSGNGPILLHIKTYRYRGHSMSDPANYRSKEEVEQYRQDNDPILNAKNHLLKQNTLDEDGLKTIDNEIKSIILEAVEFAKASPEPHADELYTDILLPSDN
jgi:pyruvate dehydrogenase E1 component alpha subunit